MKKSNKEISLIDKVRALRARQKDFIVNARQNELLRNFWLSSKNSLKQILSRASIWEQIPVYITLCPFYDGKWGIRGDYEKFDQIWIRYQKKFKASMEITEFLCQNIGDLDIRFLLADQWILIKDNYNTNRLADDLEWIKKLYSDRISYVLWGNNFSLQTFSEIWLNLEQFANLDNQYSIQDIRNILEEYEIDPDKFSNSLNIIINSFGLNGAYYLIRNYLQENQQLIKIMNWIIFINTEAVSPLNSLYDSGKNRINQTNLFAKVEI